MFIIALVIEQLGVYCFIIYIDYNIISIYIYIYIYCVTSVDPVNATLFTSMWLEMAAPAVGP